MGLILVGLIFVISFGRYFIKGMTLKKFILALTSVLLVGIIVYKVPYFSKIVSRMQSESGEFNGAAVQYRFNSLKLLLNEGRDMAYQFIGMGRGSETAYFTGVFYILNAHGVIGGLMYCIIGIFFWIKNTKYNSFLVLMVFILSVGSEYIVNYGILFYFMFLDYRVIETEKNNASPYISNEMQT